MEVGDFVRTKPTHPQQFSGVVRHIITRNGPNDIVEVQCPDNELRFTHASNLFIVQAGHDRDMRGWG